MKRAQQCSIDLLSELIDVVRKSVLDDNFLAKVHDVVA